jgi:diguanylate cyclase (GGDEF)-like protein
MRRFGANVLEFPADTATVSAKNPDTLGESRAAVLPASAGGEDAVRIDPLVEEGRKRPSATLTRREWLVAAVSAGGYLCAAVLMLPLFGVTVSEVANPTALLFIVAYALVSRIEFEIGSGAAVPTELVLVPMLFALPAAAVPLVVAIAYAIAATIDIAQGKLRPQRLPVVLSTCWHALGPAIVLAAWGTPEPRWDDVPLYVAALGAQFAFDLISSIVRESFGFGVSPAEVINFLRPVFLVDALLAPVGLTAAFVVAPTPAALLGVLPLAVLLWVFARDRHSRIDQALALTEAYEGANLEARRDGLTGVLNRLGWDEVMRSEQERIRRSGRSASLIVIDVDGLKTANDRWGHEFGDTVIRTVATVITRGVRAEDVVARIGGDEFAVLMPATSEPECERTVRRLNELIRRQRVNSIPLSASIGFTTCVPSDDLGAALRKADARMYKAKHSTQTATAAGVDRRRSAD